MEDKDKIIRELLDKIDQLSQRQKLFQDEIQKLRYDVDKLKTDGVKPIGISETVQPEMPMAESKVDTFITAITAAPPVKNISPQPVVKDKTPWEEFIGANLLNKVGIAVLVLGIGFGAKYSIDRQLLNDQTRIIMGYLAGMILLAFAYRIKKQHAGFSAVLLSGGMAVFYFITYAAYDFYGLIPQLLAFVMMVVFTVFTVFTATQYNLEVIGIIGLAGAYAVPLLLSDGSGRVGVLFSYICIINGGILFLAFKKYWWRLYYLAFILTWLTFGSWYASSFNHDIHVWISLVYSTLFFLIFYITFFAYKLIRKEALGRWDVGFMLLNSFIYFGYGYLTVESMLHGDQYLGLFALFTALIHLIACVIIYKQQDTLTDIFYFAAGMVLVFLTIAVPVQLDGNWVTLIWTGEGVLLFWIGRLKSFPVYENLSWPLIALAFVSLLHDWSSGYPGLQYYLHSKDSAFRIFLNIQFFTSMLVATALGFIFWMSRKKNHTHSGSTDSINPWLATGLPLLMIIVVYVGFYKEIESFWNHQYASSGMVSDGGAAHDRYDDSLLNFKSLWLIMYSAIFGIVLSLIQFKLKNRLLGFACLAINALVLFIFITSGLFDLSELRSHFLSQYLAEYYPRGYGHLFIRYWSFVFLFPLLWFNTKFVKEDFFNTRLRVGEALFFHFFILVLLSSELIHWLEMARVENSFRLSLSILWGAYALFLIVLGLSRNQKHIRLGAIVLFGVTLLKLFAYDMADMSTILKTVVMIILGILLLTASFIYNKNKRSAEDRMP